MCHSAGAEDEHRVWINMPLLRSWALRSRPGNGGGFAVEFQAVEEADELAIAGRFHPLVEELAGFADGFVLRVQMSQALIDWLLDEIVGAIGIESAQEFPLDAVPGHLADERVPGSLRDI